MSSHGLMKDQLIKMFKHVGWEVIINVSASHVSAVLWRLHDIIDIGNRVFKDKKSSLSNISMKSYELYSVCI